MIIKAGSPETPFLCSRALLLAASAAPVPAQAWSAAAAMSQTQSLSATVHSPNEHHDIERVIEVGRVGQSRAPPHDPPAARRGLAYPAGRAVNRKRRRVPWPTLLPMVARH